MGKCGLSREYPASENSVQISLVSEIITGPVIPTYAFDTAIVVE